MLCKKKTLHLNWRTC